MKGIILLLIGSVCSIVVLAQGSPPTITVQPLTNVITCSGSIGNLSVTATNATSYQWYLNTIPLSDGGNYAGTTTNTLSIITKAGFGNGVNYYCVVKNGYGSRTSGNGNLQVVNPPLAPGATDGFTCGPGPVTLTATGGSAGQYVWYDVNNKPITGQKNATYTIASITATTVYSVAINNGTCQSQKTTVTANYNDPPGAPGTAGGSACGSGAITLTGKGGSAGQYRWYTAAGTLIAGQQNDTYTTPVITSTTNYSVSINDGTCEGAKKTVTATINPLPVTPGVTPGSSCGPAAITLTATGGTAGQYRWYTAAGTVIAGQQNAAYTTPVLTATTNYSVSINNGTCEGAKKAVAATINTIPASPGVTPGASCGPGAVTLSATGGTAGQFRWYTAAGVAITGQQNATYTTPVLTGTTNYQVSVNNGACEGAKQAVTATINALPATPGAIPASSCGPAAVTLTASGAAAGQYRWYTSAGVVIAGQQNATYTTPVLPATTSYSVSINNGTCEGAKQVITATINPLPATPGVSSGASCGPGTITLTATGGAAGQYRWYTSAGTIIAGQQNATYTTLILTGTTTYSVAINNGTCEGAKATATATINTIPNLPGGNNNAACGSGAITLTATGATAGQYRWYSSTGILITGQTNSSYTTPVLTTTTNYGVSINNGTCEGAKTTVTATINPLPAAPETAGATTCGPGPVTLAASGAAAGQYRWYNGGVLIAGETNATYTTSVSTTTTFTVAINNGTCESAQTNVAAIVFDPQTPPSTSGNFGCGPSAVTLTASGGIDGSFQWYAAGSPVSGATNAAFTTPVISTTTDYTVTLSNSFCVSVPATVTATIRTLPGAPATTGGTNCTGLFVNLSATGATDGNYRWYTAATGGTPIDGANNSVFTTPTLTTTTTFYAAITDGSCESTRVPVIATITACNNAPPVIVPENSITVPGGTITFDLTSLISDPDKNLDLSTLRIVKGPGSGAKATLDADGVLTLDYSNVAFTGIDSLSIEVCDLDKACTTQVFTVSVDGDIHVTHGISPNNDALNEKWIIANIDLLKQTQNNHVTIYDRWGDAVFETDNYDNNVSVFKGLSKAGVELPTGTYFYSIRYTSGRKIDTGYLSLKR